MHEDILDRLAAGIAGDAGAPGPEVVSHLATCDDCRSEWERMRLAHAALLDWGGEAPPVPRPEGPARTGGALHAWALVAAALAGMVLGAGGVLVSVRGSADPARTDAADPRPVYTLFLEESVDRWPPSAGAMRPGYFEWRDSLLAAGTMAGGQRFAEDAGWYVGTDRVARPLGEVTAAERGPTNYSGLFLVHADSYEEAVRIALASPHLEFGGILVRGPY